MAEDVAENGRIGIDVSITDDDIVETAELTVEEQAEQIATAIQKYYKSYDSDFCFSAFFIVSP